MVNCAHGKDRTGLVTAMVWSCLGKSHNFIATDYAVSEVRDGSEFLEGGERGGTFREKCA